LRVVTRAYGSQLSSFFSVSLESPSSSSTGRSLSVGASRQLTEALPRSSCTIVPIRRRSAGNGLGGTSFRLLLLSTDYGQ
jgi:hypothetical protein